MENTSKPEVPTGARISILAISVIMVLLLSNLIPPIALEYLNDALSKTAHAHILAVLLKLPGVPIQIVQIVSIVLCYLVIEILYHRLKISEQILSPIRLSKGDLIPVQNPLETKNDYNPHLFPFFKSRKSSYYDAYVDLLNFACKDIGEKVDKKSFWNKLFPGRSAKKPFNCIFLIGEPGLGKFRVAIEVARRLSRRRMYQNDKLSTFPGLKSWIYSWLAEHLPVMHRNPDGFWDSFVINNKSIEFLKDWRPRRPTFIIFRDKNGSHSNNLIKLFVEKSKHYLSPVRLVILTSFASHAMIEGDFKLANENKYVATLDLTLGSPIYLRAMSGSDDIVLFKEFVDGLDVRRILAPHGVFIEYVDLWNTTQGNPKTLEILVSELVKKSNSELSFEEILDSYCHEIAENSFKEFGRTSEELMPFAIANLLSGPSIGEIESFFAVNRTNFSKSLPLSTLSSNLEKADWRQNNYRQHRLPHVESPLLAYRTLSILAGMCINPEEAFLSWIKKAWEINPSMMIGFRNAIRESKKLRDSKADIAIYNTPLDQLEEAEKIKFLGQQIRDGLSGQYSKYELIYVIDSISKSDIPFLMLIIKEETANLHADCRMISLALNHFSKRLLELDDLSAQEIENYAFGLFDLLSNLLENPPAYWSEVYSELNGQINSYCEILIKFVKRCENGLNNKILEKLVKITKLGRRFGENCVDGIIRICQSLKEISNSDIHAWSEICLNLQLIVYFNIRDYSYKVQIAELQNVLIKQKKMTVEAQKSLWLSARVGKIYYHEQPLFDTYTNDIPIDWIKWRELFFELACELKYSLEANLTKEQFHKKFEAKLTAFEQISQLVSENADSTDDLFFELLFFSSKLILQSLNDYQSNILNSHIERIKIALDKQDKMPKDSHDVHKWLCEAKFGLTLFVECEYLDVRKIEDLCKEIASVYDNFSWSGQIGQALAGSCGNLTSAALRLHDGPRYDYSNMAYDLTRKFPNEPHIARWATACCNNTSQSIGQNNLFLSQLDFGAPIFVQKMIWISKAQMLLAKFPDDGYIAASVAIAWTKLMIDGESSTSKNDLEVMGLILERVIAINDAHKKNKAIAECCINAIVALIRATENTRTEDNAKELETAFKKYRKTVERISKDAGLDYHVGAGEIHGFPYIFRNQPLVLRSMMAKIHRNYRSN